MAVNSGSLLLNYGIPPPALPAPAFDQEWTYPLQSVEQGPLNSTAQNTNPYVGVDGIQLTKVPRVPGPVDDSLTWARAIAPSAPRLDYSIDLVSLLPLFCSCALVMVYMTFP